MQRVQVGEHGAYGAPYAADATDVLGKKICESAVNRKSCKQFDQIDMSKILAVGDSLNHDIAGASNFGIDSILIASGVHKDLFKIGIENGLKNIESNRKWNFKPSYVCENFSF